MSEQQSQQMPMERVYEIVGRMYLQLWSLQEEREHFSTAIKDLSEQNKTLQTILNERGLNPTQPSAGSVNQMNFPSGEDVSKLAAQGTNVGNGAANEENNKSG